MKRSRFGVALRGGLLIFASISATVLLAMAIRFIVLGIHIDAELAWIVFGQAIKGGVFGGAVSFAFVFVMFPKNAQP